MNAFQPNIFLERGALREIGQVYLNHRIPHANCRPCFPAQAGGLLGLTDTIDLDRLESTMPEMEKSACHQLPNKPALIAAKNGLILENRAF
jgi:hypothetical protein